MKRKDFKTLEKSMEEAVAHAKVHRGTLMRVEAGVIDGQQVEIKRYANPSAVPTLPIEKMMAKVGGATREELDQMLAAVEAYKKATVRKEFPEYAGLPELAEVGTVGYGETTDHYEEIFDSNEELLYNLED